MIVPFRLAKRAAPAAVDAFLVRAPVPLAGAAAFRVRGGLLLVPAESTELRPPGAIRLRRLRGDLFVPFDADLVPALLPDEQTALTADRGLVVLPSGEALAFDPATPVPAAELFALPPVRRDDWQPFPDRPPRPDRLTRIEHPAPPVAAIEDVVGRAPPPPRPGDPVPEDARPPAAGPVAGASGRAKLAAARALAALGRLLRMPGLAKRGAELARRAAEQVPRLAESLLGAQEAALREVLRQLQAGDVENALKRAPIAVPDPDAGPTAVDHSANLSARDPRYSLSALVTGGGLAGGWLGGGDVWASLAAEYRRLANEAVRRGDYRRAAYLFGVLLRDPRAAATALSQGGLHRDAGVILRDRVKDAVAAAREFEKAGDADEAVRLYLRAEQPEAAADVLVRIGETDRANELYRRAAAAHADRGRHLAAGDLLRTKAVDPVAAAGYYQAGWRSAGADQLPCGERLFDHHQAAADWPGVRGLLAEAEDALAPPRSADAGRFFGYARAAGHGLPAGLRDELADRTRLLFAAHVRTAVRPDRVAGELFGPGGGWPGPVARDAAYAARPPKPSAAAPVGHPPPVQVVVGTVTAVAVGWGDFDLVIGTTAGVAVWRPASGKVEPVCPTGGRTVVGLSTDFAARRVFVLISDGEDLTLAGFERQNERFEPAARQVWPKAGPLPVYLQPAITLRAGEPTVTVGLVDTRLAFRGMNLWADDNGPFDPDRMNTRLLADGGGGTAWDWYADRLHCLDPDRKPLAEWRVPWTPGVPVGSSLAVPPLDWTGQRARQLEVVGVDRDGVLHWNRWQVGEPGAAAAGLTDPDRFFAACVSAGGRVAAVTGRNEVVWLKAADARFERLGSVRLQVPARAVAVVARPDAKEVAVVFEDGSAVRLADPT